MRGASRTGHASAATAPVSFFAVHFLANCARRSTSLPHSLKQYASLVQKVMSCVTGGKVWTPPPVFVGSGFTTVGKAVPEVNRDFGGGT